ncbi:MAG: OmpA family protein [Gammaproteobacteria bacterium]|nr:OmpA family protein [Gammaproteobacteria bacterium]
MKKTLFATLLGLFLVGTASAGIQQFKAPVHMSKWTAKSQKSLCSLKHSIPSYGEVTILKGRTIPMTTLIQTRFNVLKGGNADLRALPPAWKTGADIQEIKKIEFQYGNIPFILGTDLSQGILDSLANGMYISLTHMQSVESNNGWRVEISPVNISKELEKFLQCSGDFPLIRAGRKSTVHFATGKWNLTYSNLARLIAVSDYLSTHPKFKRIVLDGYADNRGQNAPNKILSRNRANAVKAFLIAKGIPAKKIKVVAHGEVDEIALNKTPALRAKNRRVNISIIK